MCNEEDPNRMAFYQYFYASDLLLSVKEKSYIAKKINFNKKPLSSTPQT